MPADTVPVFMPPLAHILALAEKQAGRPLDEAAVLAVRDAAAVMMLSGEHAAQMDGRRGFRDVDPEDAWADWHRLRVEVTGQGYLPKLVLCVVGDRDFGEVAEGVLAPGGVELEVRDHDPRIVEAFQASSFRPLPSLAPAELTAIGEHEKVVYLLSDHYGAAAGPEVARRMLGLGAELLAAGGLGMKCESSGIAHGRERWLELAAQADDVALFDAFVQYLIGDAEDFYTCGLHLLGRPDLVAARSLCQDPRDLAELFRVFALYLLIERPRFASGHTFQTERAAPRYQVTWEVCRGYDEDDVFFNPFGRQRFR
jgi:hypothetical protein